jgi:hypothetical protein
LFRNRKRRGKGKGIREKIKSFVTSMISGLQRIDLFYWITSLFLKPIHLILFRRNIFIFSGTTLFTLERVYLMFTQKAGIRNKEKGKREQY